MRRLIDRGESITDAWNATLATYPADTAENKGLPYARFADKSYMRVWLNTHFSQAAVQVLSHHTEKFAAEKIIEDIHIYCSECGRGLWCDLKGRGTPKETFDMAGTLVVICESCQRDIVKRHIVGE